MKPTLYELPNPLTQEDMDWYVPVFKNLQGNLLKAHGRPCAAHVFIRFHHREAAVAFYQAMAHTVTSVCDQNEQIRKHRAHGREALFEACMISASGYQMLGLSLDGFEYSFTRGMKAVTDRLSDPPTEKWQCGFQREIHAMVMIAHAKLTAVKQRVSEIEAVLNSKAELFVEMGQAMFRAGDNHHQEQIEHFGFSDGVSQPVFFVHDLPADRQNWDPSAGPNLILCKDPHGQSDDDCGSYFVFRKLEQNVKGFRGELKRLADSLGVDSALAGALVMGRFADGTPVEAANSASQAKPPANNFSFHGDPDGNRCPFASHIRKVNPRGDTADLETERGRRIARRGISYLDSSVPLGSVPEKGAGLLFQCCCTDIGQQFEFLHSNWSGNRDFPKPSVGTDPIIGEGPSTQQWPSPWNSDGRVFFSFHEFVTMQGGEYFFVPSISFLRAIA